MINIKEQIEIMKEHDLVIERVLLRERVAGQTTMEIQFKKEQDDERTV